MSLVAPMIKMNLGSTVLPAAVRWMLSFDGMFITIAIALLLVRLNRALRRRPHNNWDLVATALESWDAITGIVALRLRHDFNRNILLLGTCFLLTFNDIGFLRSLFTYPDPDYPGSRCRTGVAFCYELPDLAQRAFLHQCRNPMKQVCIPRGFWEEPLGQRAILVTLTVLVLLVGTSARFVLGMFAFTPALSAEHARHLFSDYIDSLIQRYPNRNFPRRLTGATPHARFQALLEHLQRHGARICEHQPDDRAQSRATSHEYYWARDLERSPLRPRRRYGKDDVIVLQNVDYHVDMNRFLNRGQNNRATVLLRTLSPEEASCCDGPEQWFFNELGELEFTWVKTGARYKHQLWNYASGEDRTVLSSGDGLRCYKVMKWRLSRTEMAVLFVPRYSIPPKAVPLARAIGIRDTPLTRLDPVYGNYARIDSIANGAHQVSIAPVGSPSTPVTLPIGLLLGIASVKSVHDKTVSAHTVETFVKDHYADLPVSQRRLNANRLLDFLVEQGVSCLRGRVEPAHLVYQHTEEGVELQEPPKAPLEVVMQPVLNASVMPADGPQAAHNAVKRRVEDLATPDVPITKDLRKLTDLFVSFFPKHALVPVEPSEVWKRQSRPAQRRILAEADASGGAVGRMQCFVKKEPYGGFSDARNISTVEPNQKLSYSRYTYPASELMKTFRWYAFGRSPKELAERVAEVCSGAEFVVATDFSRFDGRENNRGRYVCETVMKHLFDTKSHPELTELMKSQYNNTVRGTHQVSYSQGTSRASGSPETSLFNTIVNAFIAFAASLHGKPRTPSEAKKAWEGLGVYGGDDGLTASVPRGSYMRASKLMGHKLDYARIAAGEWGVAFLSRSYSREVWTGETSSVASPRRAIRQLHLARKSSRAPEDTLSLKLLSYSFSDGNSPGFKQLIETLERVHAPFAEMRRKLDVKTREEVREVVGYNAGLALDHSPDEQWPNSPGKWMEELWEMEIPEIPLQRLVTALANMKSVEELLAMAPLHAPIAIAPPKKVAVVFDGQTVDPVGEKEQEPSSAGKEEAGPDALADSEEQKESSSGQPTGASDASAN